MFENIILRCWLKRDDWDGLGWGGENGNIRVSGKRNIRDYLQIRTVLRTEDEIRESPSLAAGSVGIGNNSLYAFCLTPLCRLCYSFFGLFFFFFFNVVTGSTRLQMPVWGICGLARLAVESISRTQVRVDRRCCWPGHRGSKVARLVGLLAMRGRVTCDTECPI
jgi:hypothetical protein